MTFSQFSVPREDRYFQDYEPGLTYDLGSVTVSEADILDFARRFDPQDMHVDPAKARAGRFKGLIASGWHTCSLAMRLFVDGYLSAPASLSSPGIDEIRWPNPLRPGDTLRLRATTLECIPSRNKSDRGVVRTRLEAFNQHDQPLLSLIANSIIGGRPAPSQDAA